LTTFSSVASGDGAWGNRS